MIVLRQGLAIFIFFLLSVWNCHAQQQSPLTYLALGDSYTIGESVPKEDRWPVQLVDSLREKGYSIQDPNIIAKTGWTTYELIDTVQKADPATNYDLVTLLIGVNNQYRGYDISTFRKEFKILLEKAIAFADGQKNHVFVVSIPDYGVTPFGQQKNPRKIARELKQYNSISANIAEKQGVSFINITPISKRAESDSTLVAEDGLHPSGKMYQKWVSRILPNVISNLK